jgi:GNAT superfamily N-acetyltransferase
MAEAQDRAAILVRPAAQAEVAVVVSILAEAAAWLMSQGVPQWQQGDFTTQAVEHWMHQGVVLLAMRQQAAIGTVALMAENAEDAALWQGMPTTPAMYVHKLAVRRAVAGQGISLALLQAAEGLAREGGNAVVRLDCWAGNVALRRFYQGAGYTLCGMVAEQDWECALFEKRL